MAELSVLGVTLAPDIKGELEATDHKKVMVGDVEPIQKNKKINKGKGKDTTVVENSTSKENVDNSVVRTGDTSSDGDELIV